MSPKMNKSAKVVALLLTTAIGTLAYVRYQNYNSTHFVGASYVRQMDNSAFDITMIDKAGPTSFTPVALAWVGKLAAVAATAAAAAKVVETLAETVDSVDHLVEATAEVMEWNEEQKNEAKQEMGGPNESTSFPKLMAASSIYPGMSVEDAEYLSHF